jgi:6-pyruvoyltetrahydropterin/6-carboxytetrahydropterin synthase
VVDISAASDALKKVLATYNLKNLDELSQFLGQNTTTEFMCKQVFDGIANTFSGMFKGTIKITIAESHAAWASYTGAINQ